MPTILLQEIRDLLTAFLTAINNKIETMLEKLSDIKDNTDAIKEDTANLDDIKTNTDVLPDMATDVIAIKSYSQSIDSKMDITNAALGNIETSSGAIVTPITQIKANTDAIKSDVATIKNNSVSIANNVNAITTNTGSTASYAEDIATNTLNSYNKLVTIASDTTQMRADNQTIIAILNQIYDKL